MDPGRPDWLEFTLILRCNLNLLGAGWIACNRYSRFCVRFSAFFLFEVLTSRIEGISEIGLPS